MVTTALKDEIRFLPRSEQYALMAFILEVLQEEEKFVLSQAWKDELDKREEDYLSGKEKLHTWQEVKQQITSGK